MERGREEAIRREGGRDRCRERVERENNKDEMRERVKYRDQMR